MQQVEQTPKQLEFDTTLIDPANETPVVEENTEEQQEEDEVSTQEPPQQPRLIVVDRSQ